MHLGMKISTQLMFGLGFLSHQGGNVEVKMQLYLTSCGQKEITDRLGL